MKAGDPANEDLTRHDRVVSTTATGSTAVTASHESSSAVWGADLLGLAAAVASSMTRPTLIAVTSPATSASDGDRPVRFPDPVGVRQGRSTESPLPGVSALLTPTVDNWCAIRVTGERTLALVDETDFTLAIVLAAAAVLPAGPVWANADAFLTLVKELGLRFAQAVG